MAGSLLMAAAAIAIETWNALPVHGASAWNRHTAASYLDHRELWWQSWSPAQESQGTLCISCHTTIPYAMARPGLSHSLGQTSPSAAERTMRSSVDKRVLHWTDMVPFYSDARNGAGKTAQSHATEAVLNAVVLANFDAQAGLLRPITRTAFDNAWALQRTSGEDTGGWPWQDFHLAPWESSESAYQGAALLILAAVNAPEHFSAEPTTRYRLDLVNAYLRLHYVAQPLLNRLYVLWASATERSLLTPTERQTLFTQIHSLQQPDGGWRTASLEKIDRVDGSAQPSTSDGFATALVVLALQATTRHDAAVQRGLTWLTRHQQQNGSWSAASLNKERDPESDSYLFMTDAATAYAALALDNSRPY